MKQGKLIVIDGSDGSGKATQTQLLVERLRAEHIPVETMDFPRYTDNLIGKLIGEAIAGEHGDFLHMDPYITSLVFATDRFESSHTIKQWLQKGYVVVLDRYVSANQIHQGGKLPDRRKRKTFLNWLDKLEYGVFGLPKPDITIYLHMPLQHSINLLKEKSARGRKKYIKRGRRDTFENDTDFLKNAQKSADSLMRTHTGWYKITCALRGTIRERADIHHELWGIVHRVITQ